MSECVDYLVLGSGLSSLTFSSLMAKSGRSVRILEAHEYFGGYGHTFKFGDYSFNAQLHYVTSCGKGDAVDLLLHQLELEHAVAFHTLNPEGYDRVYCHDKMLKIPFGLDKLRANMMEIVPNAKTGIEKFIDILIDFQQAADYFPRHMKHLYQVLPALPKYFRLFKYRNATLQQVFDACDLPKILQTLVSGQLHDYLLPPKELSFLIWAALFTGYSKGAYYPTKHFEHYINCLVQSIQKNGGELIPNERVVEFIMDGRTVKGVRTQKVDPKTGIPSGPLTPYYGKTIVCNFDPKKAAQMIGIEKFSSKVQRALEYDYSYSSFVLYGIVQGINLADYGFGDWNLWHCQPDHNEAYHRMYSHQDYSKPYFGFNCRSLHTPDSSHCVREGCQMFEMITVANYDYWKTLKMRDHKAYNLKKKEVLDHLLDVVEQFYVPNIREHLIFKMTGSPTTNERYVNTPHGGAYGVNLTPKNFQFSRKLTANTSLNNFYFCSAASGVAGFGGTTITGIQLYEKLTGDYLH